jgi:hypothetical protein
MGEFHGPLNLLGNRESQLLRGLFILFWALLWAGTVVSTPCSVDFSVQLLLE